MQSSPIRVGFLRAYAFPVVWLFALPAFALWFAGHAMERFDARFMAVVEPQIQRATDLDAEQKRSALEYYRALPPSMACLDTKPELADYRESLGEACSDVRQYGWIRDLSRGSLGLGAASVVFALLCAAASFVSRTSQYVSFVLGWNVLKLVGAAQTVMQGALAVLLSYWMTALWTERYFPKLILIAGVLALLGVYKVVVAIFRRPPTGIDVEGELVEESSSPELWARIRALSTQIGTAPPDHVVAGIDDNFFVTEGEVRVGERTLKGRTLYVSLSLLRILKRSEAEAVLSHELGHFAGGDTGHSKKMSPMIARFWQYMQALHEGLITRPIFHFMLAYYGLFALALGRSNREREFAADTLAAKHTSARDIAHSLVKIGAYASYRGRVEEALFERNEQHEHVGIAERVARGFSGYANTEAVHFDLHEAVTPHPFDSHPPLSERLKNVAFNLERTQYESVLLEPSESSWVEGIGGGAEMEQRMWSAYESRFAAAHELALAYRYEPADDQERAHVEKFFPPVSFAGKEGAPSVAFDYEKITHGEWQEGPLPYEQVSSAAVDERLFKKYLDLTLSGSGLFKGKRSICLSKVEDPDGVLAAFNRYYGRHRHMVEQRAEKAA